MIKILVMELPEVHQGLVAIQQYLDNDSYDVNDAIRVTNRILEEYLDTGVESLAECTEVMCEFNNMLASINNFLYRHNLTHVIHIREIIVIDGMGGIYIKFGV